MSRKVHIGVFLCEMTALGVLRFITSHPLNSHRKLNALVRFAKWQIGSRLVPGAVSVDWIGGAKILVRPGETGLTGNVYAGLHEFHDMSFVLHALRPDDLFVDVGANLGSYTILACAAVGARGFAFEPVPATFARLTEHIHLNNIATRALCRNVGIGREPAVMRFTADLDTLNHVLAPDEVHERAIDVPIVTLDAALEGAAPFLIKIDVEGYELPALEGSRATLSNPALNAIIIELNGSGARYGFDESQILRLLIEYGFSTYRYDPLDRRLTNAAGRTEPRGNTLFLRNEALIRERLRTAPKICVNDRSF